ncbi:hypothetical protein BCR43DRAFT_135939 [Syncephalastrum racemosum]|uniref:C2H2-type domain-containing protein n=1 Tax=Syncephalastrum racemosum TaxID=13706 RepID=A0A1X2HLL7_SYNRA|nr:hypothetical protein BCR43DRAFT_135939 [Syncephalastrum racemosum]
MMVSKPRPVVLKERAKNPRDDRQVAQLDFNTPTCAGTKQSFRTPIHSIVQKSSYKQTLITHFLSPSPKKSAVTSSPADKSSQKTGQSPSIGDAHAIKCGSGAALLSSIKREPASADVWISPPSHNTAGGSIKERVTLRLLEKDEGPISKLDTLNPADRAVVKDTMYRCGKPGCFRSYRHKPNLKRHIRRVHEPKVCHCYIYVYMSTQYYYSFYVCTEKRSVQPTPYICDVPGCNLSFVFYKNYARHIQQKHSGAEISGDRATICTSDDHSSSRAGDPHRKRGNCRRITYKKASHSEPYRCDFEGCSKVFIYHASFQRHMNAVHYAGASALKAPKVLAKRFRCDYTNCSGAFSSSKDLQTHKKYNHEAHLAPYRCREHGCAKIFKTALGFMKHMNKHQTRSLSWRDACLKTREYSKPFPCEYPYCLKAYAYKSSLRKHKKDHHQVHMATYQCKEDGCNMIFLEAEFLKDHMDEKHTIQKASRKDTCLFLNYMFKI